MASSRKSAAAEADPLYRRFAATAAATLKPGTAVTLALSGGLDSVVLLDLLWRYRCATPFPLAAFHFHHGLNPQADHWLSYCRELCARLAVPFSCGHARLTRQPGDSLEALAREARYAALAELDCDYIALAHHGDDQAETVLYRLLRGAGPHGAAAMLPLRPFAAGCQLWRPLLAEPRTVLADYAALRGLGWIEDDSNASLDYDRNYLRHQVMPVLQARFPAAAATLARNAQHFAEAAGLLDELAKADAGSTDPHSPDATLPLSLLTDLSLARQRNLLRWFLARRADLHPDTSQLNELLRQLLSARADAVLAVRLGGWMAHSYRGLLYLEPRAEAIPTIEPAWADGATLAPPSWPGRLSWSPAADGIAAHWLPGLEMRPREGGERLRLRSDGPSRLLKHLLQEAGIPPWRRGGWPLLWQGEVLVAVPGVAIAAACRNSTGAGWQPIWQWGRGNI
ncbi:tRNA lysidine(34) synthetase TilS [Chitinimonas lacunae]|uniref:tRNA(Ile)-lysidine synthase n=1 Tax=Chitinimonas lacunae TaxID=1963018 RepID=A0ABV8MM56_9NEIS